MEKIEGVQIKALRVIPDERGRLMEILRSDDPLFEKFGQVYMTTGYPGVVKGWHYHKIQTDHFAVVKGMIKVAMFDGRFAELGLDYRGQRSSTAGILMEVFMGQHNPVLLKIPPYILHGFKAVGTEEAIIVNVPTEPYCYQQPDEFRLPPDDPRIPYDWRIKEG